MRNRGKESSDDKWFAPHWHPIFKEALDDLNYMLCKGYAEPSAMQLVGNRYKLNKRQRQAISRMCCSDDQIKIRKNTEKSLQELSNEIIEIDGFNLLILIEGALSGAYIFKGRDGLYRDIAGVHGTYKRVSRTEEAVSLIGKTLSKFNVEKVIWYLDKPVSNSGMLKKRLLDWSDENEYNWKVALEFNPDKVLAESKNIVISADAWVLDRASQWCNLGAWIINNHILEANIVEA